MSLVRRREALLTERLADARGREVVFVSHCLLDENTRYLGGAFHRGAVPEMATLLRSGVAVCQMPCPEQRVWGGVLKRRILPAYGLRDSPLYALRAPLLRLFVWWTRVRYHLLARRVVREVREHRRAGVLVRAVVGVGASPSCGVATTLDLRRSFETLARCPLAAIDRRTANEDAVAACRVAGEGLFTRTLRRQLERRHAGVPFVEYDLVAEMRGLPQPPGGVARLLGAAGDPVTTHPDAP
jgi:uncharacterized protein YbbK (DUF523 family)